jgi:hypothetical protein
MKKVSIGFTGTAEGATTWQMDALAHAFAMLQKSGAQLESFHHGDCVGADEQAHKVACTFQFHITIHPPLNDKKRANCVGDIILPEKDYIERNHDIVDASDVMFATPKSKDEELRSGTWTTIRYAQKQVLKAGSNKRLIIIWPDGTTLNITKPVTNNA